MARWFDSATPVLYQRAHRMGEETRLILYPAFGFRVVAPPRRERALDLMQRAILRLHAAGTRSGDKIAGLLSVEPTLVSLIQGLLHQRGLLTKAGPLSKKGEQALRDEDVEDQALAVGFVFRDPWTYEVFPRFVTEPRFVDAIFTGPRAKVSLGTPGHPDNRDAFVFWPAPSREPEPPSPAEVLHAARRHWHSQRSEFDESDEPLPRFPVMELQRVSLMDEAATPFFLATEVYMNAPGAAEWDVRDPFGSASVPWLRRNLRQHAEALPAFQKHLMGMQDALARGLIELGTTVAELDEQARQRLVAAIPAIDLGHPVAERLLVYEQLLLEAEQRGPKLKPHHLENLLVEGGKVLERLFGVLMEGSPPLPPNLDMGRSPANGDLYDEWARRTGLRTPLPARMHQQPGGKVRAAAILQARMLRALWAAVHNPSHALRSMAIAMPDMYVALSDFSNERGAAAHDSRERPSRAGMTRHHDLILKVCASYFQHRVAGAQPTGEALAHG